MPTWLLPALCMLGCPLIMGVMMIGMGRDRDATKLDRAIQKRNQQSVPSQPHTTALASATRSVRRVWCGMCINWNVVGVFALAAVATAVIRPQLLVAVGPVLLVLVCPLSMVLMLRRQTRGTPATQDNVRGELDPQDGADHP